METSKENKSHVIITLCVGVFGYCKDTGTYILLLVIL